MSKRDKILERFRQNPKNVRFEEIETLLLNLGFTMRQKGTSHAFFKLGSHIINIPIRKPFVKQFYVTLLLDELDKLFAEEE
jgi:hypothetical protein